MDRNETAKQFLVKNKAYREHIHISDADTWEITEDDGEVVGVIGMTYGKHKDRIKAFYVRKDKRGSGLGSRLCSEILQRTNAGTVTTFATRDSKPIFEKNGFRVLNINKNGIYFMERSDRI